MKERTTGPSRRSLRYLGYGLGWIWGVDVVAVGWIFCLRYLGCDGMWGVRVVV